MASTRPLTIRILLARDMTTETATQLAEHYVPQAPYFDLCLLCGPFTHRPLMSREDDAVAEGDMALTIAQIENIVCRVCYLPSAADPPSSRSKQLHLTPNSVSIHGGSMLLADTLAIGGFMCGEDSSHAAVDSDDEEEPVLASSHHQPGLRGVVSTSATPAVHSIVVQQGGSYVPSVTDYENLCLYICCDNDENCVNSSDAHGHVHTEGKVVVIHPPSLSQTRRYMALGLQEKEDGWAVTFTEERELLRQPVSIATLPYTPKKRNH